MGFRGAVTVWGSVLWFDGVGLTRWRRGDEHAAGFRSFFACVMLDVDTGASPEVASFLVYDESLAPAVRIYGIDGISVWIGCVPYCSMSCRK